MVKSFNMLNKLLSLDYTKEFILIGDSRGIIYKFTTYKKLAIVHDCKSPISCIKAYNENIYYSTWDGDLYLNHRKINVLPAIIKTFVIALSQIFVAVELKIFIFNLDLEIINCLDVPHKVSCMTNTPFSIICGFNLPKYCIINIDTQQIEIFNIPHDTGILSIQHTDDKILTGSVDGKLNLSTLYSSECETLFSGKKWIRDVFDMSLISFGNEVIELKDGVPSVLYSHSDEVTRVIKWNNMVVSIGLDGSLKIKEDAIYKDEEREIAELNRLFGN